MRAVMLACLGLLAASAALAAGFAAMVYAFSPCMAAHR